MENTSVIDENDLTPEIKANILREVRNDCRLAIEHPTDWGQISRATTVSEMRDALYSLVVNAMENADK